MADSVVSDLLFCDGLANLRYIVYKKYTEGEKPIWSHEDVLLYQMNVLMAQLDREGRYSILTALLEKDYFAEIYDIQLAGRCVL